MRFELSAAIEARFWSRVDRSSAEGCWPWLGWTDDDGYGVMTIEQGRAGVRAHRLAFTFSRFFVPPSELFVCHKCDAPVCCRPNHLFLGDSIINNADRVAKGRSACGDNAGLRRHPERAARGERNGRAKLTIAQVEAIRAAVATGGGIRPTARTFRVTPRAIRLIVRGETWQATGAPTP